MKGGSNLEASTLLTQVEAADFLRLSPRTLERQRTAGTGPKFVKAGRRVLYRSAELEAWTEKRTFGSTAEAQVVS
jgi:predicted DNA-binding transcriptional regulator AlpA